MKILRNINGANTETKVVYKNVAKIDVVCKKNVDPAFISNNMSDAAFKAGPRFAQILHMWRPNRLLRGSCLGVSANHSAQPNEEHSA